MINFIIWLIVGGVIGLIASLIMRTDAQQGIFLNIVVGIIGAALAGWLISPLLGIPTINQDTFSFGALVVSLIGAVILTTLLQVAVVYVPFLQNIFETMSLPLRDLGIAALLSTSLFFVVELQKWLIRRNSPE